LLKETQPTALLIIFTTETIIHQTYNCCSNVAAWYTLVYGLLSLLNTKYSYSQHSVLNGWLKSWPNIPVGLYRYQIIRQLPRLLYVQSSTNNGIIHPKQTYRPIHYQNFLDCPVIAW